MKYPPIELTLSGKNFAIFNTIFGIDVNETNTNKESVFGIKTLTSVLL